MASANQFHSTSIPLDNHSVPPSAATTGLVFPANYGIKPEAALVMDWSPEEQYVLENGLAKLKDDPKVSKYVKIAAALPDKTVRDVALRCRWMPRIQVADVIAPNAGSNGTSAMTTSLPTEAHEDCVRHVQAALRNANSTRTKHFEVARARHRGGRKPKQAHRQTNGQLVPPEDGVSDTTTP